MVSPCRQGSPALFAWACAEHSEQHLEGRDRDRHLLEVPVSELPAPTMFVLSQRPAMPSAASKDKDGALSATLSSLARLLMTKAARSGCSVTGTNIWTPFVLYGPQCAESPDKQMRAPCQEAHTTQKAPGPPKSRNLTCFGQDLHCTVAELQGHPLCCASVMFWKRCRVGILQFWSGLLRSALLCR